MVLVHIRVVLCGAKASALIRCTLERRDAVGHRVDHQEPVQHICLLKTILHVIFSACICHCVTISHHWWYHLRDASTIHFSLNSMADHPGKLFDIYLTQSIWVNVFGLGDLTTCFTMLNKDEFKHLLIWSDHFLLIWGFYSWCGSQTADG